MTSGDATSGPLLDPRLLSRLEQLQLATRRPLAGALAGGHRSPRHGTSTDFADWREYHPGDDFRRIDYHLYARLGVLLLKLFEAEDESEVRLLIDTSASMALHRKLDQAVRLAGALGFVALVRRDPVSVHTFPDHTAAPRFTGRGAAPALFATLSALEPGGTTNVAAAAAHLLGKSRRHGVTILFSDLLAADWRDGIRRLPARGADVTVAHIDAAEDRLPPATGDVELVDAETGERVPVTLDRRTLTKLAAAADEWADSVAAACRGAGLGYLRIDSRRDIEQVLLGGARQSGLLR